MKYKSVSGILLASLLTGVMAMPAMAATPETHFNQVALQSRPVVQTGVKIDRNLHIERVFSQFVVRAEPSPKTRAPGRVKTAAPEVKVAPKPSPVSAPQPLPLPPGR